MALVQVDFDDNEEKIIKEVSDKYDLNKPKAIRKIVSEHKEKK